jgi:hypothetical protein
MTTTKTFKKGKPSSQDELDLQRIFEDATHTVGQADEAMRKLPPLPYGELPTSPAERTIAPPHPPARKS